MQINRISFGSMMGNVGKSAYFERQASRSEASHYPVGRGKVERLKYESEHGWCDNNSGDTYARELDRKRADRAFEETMKYYDAAVSALS